MTPAELMNLDGDLASCLENNPQLLIPVESITGLVAEIPGENDGVRWAWIVTLAEGGFGALCGGCDFTGWDCKSSCEGWVFPDAKEAALWCGAARMVSDWATEYDGPKFSALSPSKLQRLAETAFLGPNEAPWSEVAALVRRALASPDDAQPWLVLGDLLQAMTAARDMEFRAVGVRIVTHLAAGKPPRDLLGRDPLELLAQLNGVKPIGGRMEHITVESVRPAFVMVGYGDDAAGETSSDEGLEEAVSP